MRVVDGLRTTNSLVSICCRIIKDWFLFFTVFFKIQMCIFHISATSLQFCTGEFVSVLEQSQQLSNMSVPPLVASGYLIIQHPCPRIQPQPCVLIHSNRWVELVGVFERVDVTAALSSTPGECVSPAVEGNEAKMMECLFSDNLSLPGLIRAEPCRRQVLI